MPEPSNLNHDELCQATVYEIRLRGHLGPEWAEWFEGFAIALEENGDTLLVGPVADQAALHGLLKRVPGSGYAVGIGCLQGLDGAQEKRDIQ